MNTYEESRRAFDRPDEYAGVFMIPQANWTNLQHRLNAWSNRDYGYQPAERRVLGLMEELAEFTHATDQAKRCDALADMSICLIQLCTSHRLDAGVLIECEDRIEEMLSAHDWIGRLAHLELKYLQGIRGTRDEFGLEDRETVRRGVALNAIGLFRWLQVATRRDAEAHPYRFRGPLENAYIDLVGGVANEVMTREKNLLPRTKSVTG